MPTISSRWTAVASSSAAGMRNCSRGAATTPILFRFRTADAAEAIMSVIRLQAFGDLLRSYGAVFRAAWSMRAQLDGEPKLSHEREFLPANLELVETPVHPAPRWTMRILVALAAVAILLAVFGRLDIVAVAEGKLIPDERVKIIQPAITGVVRSILVEDGQRVEAGQLLMQLDATQAAADSDNARTARI